MGKGNHLLLPFLRISFCNLKIEEEKNSKNPLLTECLFFLPKNLIYFKTLDLQIQKVYFK